jgi:threonine dehydratase
MPTRGDPQAGRQRVLARRSTLAGVGGIVLVALAMLLTLTHQLGNAVPTVLAIVGVGSLVAGVSTGAMQVVDRYRRSDSDFDR